MVKLAAEVGGTFTDLIWLDEAGQARTHKVPSTPADPSIGVVAGIEEALGDGSAALAVLVHGSTVATNAVLERKGCRAGLLTTRGFGDVLVIRRQLRDDIYSVVATAPAPIIPLARTAEASERLTATGEIQTPLDEADLLAAIDALMASSPLTDDAPLSRAVTEGVPGAPGEGLGVRAPLDALAICFLHSYRNPVHERRARELIAARYPDLPIVLSSEVLPTFREYERTSTTALAAYLAPLVGHYVGHLEGYLRERGSGATLFVMQSSGGLLPSAGIRARPVEMLQSGPAAGVIAAIRVAERLGDPNLITLDMGGTSTDVCLVREGVAAISAEREVDGLAVGIPSVDIANVGAGGGSLAWLDRGGMLQVGPRSAGARPGPACYGFGGNEPAITDAAVQLGWMRPHRFLGGRMALYPERATVALTTLAEQLGQPVDATAQALIEIAVAHINQAVRLVSVQRGHDPRGYALYAFGGMGPLVGALVAEEMRIRRVVIPPHPGLFSALGLLVADLERTYRQTNIAPLTDAAIPAIVAGFDRLRVEAEAEFAGYGHPAERLEIATHLEMRYRGQGFELLVPVDLARLARDGAPYLTAAFHAAHQARYGARPPVAAIEVVTYRLVARVPTDRDILDHLRVDDEHQTEQSEGEEATMTFRGQQRPCRYLWRANLPRGYTSRGLTIVEEPTATTLVPPGWGLTVGKAGDLILDQE